MRLNQTELDKLSLSDLILLRKEGELIPAAVKTGIYYEESEWKIKQVAYEVQNEIKIEIIDRIKCMFNLNY